jgi:hypothetical protein
MPKMLYQQTAILGCEAEKKFQVLQRDAPKPIRVLALQVFVVPDAGVQPWTGPTPRGALRTSSGSRCRSSDTKLRQVECIKEDRLVVVPIANEFQVRRPSAPRARPRHLSRMTAAPVRLSESNKNIGPNDLVSHAASGHADLVAR